jgi:hypothetical protein
MPRAELPLLRECSQNTLLPIPYWTCSRDLMGRTFRRPAVNLCCAECLLHTSAGHLQGHSSPPGPSRWTAPGFTWVGQERGPDLQHGCGIFASHFGSKIKGVPSTSVIKKMFQCSIFKNQCDNMQNTTHLHA